MSEQENKPAIRFRHHFLPNGSVLSVCTQLNHETKDVKVGWSLYNPKDEKWIRKVGNNLARERLAKHPLSFTLSSDEPIICDYLSLRALQVLLVSAQRTHGSDNTVNTKSIPRQTLLEVQIECIILLNQLGRRLGCQDIGSLKATYF